MTAATYRVRARRYGKSRMMHLGFARTGGTLCNRERESRRETRHDFGQAPATCWACREAVGEVRATRRRS